MYLGLESVSRCSLEHLVLVSVLRVEHFGLSWSWRYDMSVFAVVTDIRLTLALMKFLPYIRPVYMSWGTCDLEKVEKMKDLGFIVDEKLKFYDQFYDHIHERVNKAYSMLGIIKRNFKYNDKVAFLSLYKGLVRSTVEYSSSVWNPSYMGQIEELL